MPRQTAELRAMLVEVLKAADRLDPLVAAYIAQALTLIEKREDYVSRH